MMKLYALFVLCFSMYLLVVISVWLLKKILGWIMTRRFWCRWLPHYYADLFGMFRQCVRCDKVQLNQPGQGWRDLDEKDMEAMKAALAACAVSVEQVTEALVRIG